jgi:hypothetical protein
MPLLSVQPGSGDDDDPSAYWRALEQENRQLRAWVLYIESIAEYRGRELDRLRSRRVPGVRNVQLN